MATNDSDVELIRATLPAFTLATQMHGMREIASAEFAAIDDLGPMAAGKHTLRGVEGDVAIFAPS